MVIQFIIIMIISSSLLILQSSSLIAAVHGEEDSAYDEINDYYEADRNQYSTCSHLCRICTDDKIECLNTKNVDSLKQMFSSYRSKELKEITVTGTSLSRFDTLFNEQVELKQLTKLDLSNNKIESISSIPFRNMPNLQELILDGNNLVLSSSLSALLPCSSKLTLLSLNAAFSNGTTSKERSLEISKEIAGLLRESRLRQLSSLELMNNPITEINLDAIFCASPNIKRLNFHKSLIEKFEFTNECGGSDVGDNDHRGQDDFKLGLELIDFTFNKLATINDSMLNSLIELKKAASPQLSVHLATNTFVCDCLMYHFWKFLIDDESSSRFIVDRDQLICNNELSFAIAKSKPLITTRLGTQCGPSAMTTKTDPTYEKLTFTTPKRKFFFSNGTTTANNNSSSQPENDPQHHSNRLFIFFVCTLVASGLIGATFRYYLKRLWKKLPFMTYTTIDETAAERAAMNASQQREIVQMSDNRIRFDHSMSMPLDDDEIRSTSNPHFNNYPLYRDEPPSDRQQQQTARVVVEKFSNQLREIVRKSDDKFKLIDRHRENEYQTEDVVVAVDDNPESITGQKALKKAMKDYRIKQLLSSDESDSENRLYSVLDDNVNNNNRINKSQK